MWCWIMSNGFVVDRHQYAWLGFIGCDSRRFSAEITEFRYYLSVPNARVALSDEIGALFNARIALMIIGERPGLSAADSLGAYLTYSPQSSNTDAERNCLSNIRPPEGLSYQLAALKLCYLSSEALRLGYSGVVLKDDMPAGLP